MSEYEFFKCDVSKGIARVTLSKPEKHNVLDIAMMTELNHILEMLAKDSDLKCVVFPAEGKSWCAGVEVGDHKPEMVDDMIDTFNRMLTLISNLEVPTIAAVQGACLGGGMEMAIACDIIVASEKAVFGQPEIKLGFFPPFAAMRLPQLVGPAKAIEICTTGRRYKAAEAQSFGFVAHVAAVSDFDDKVEELIKEISHCSPLIIRLNKKAVKDQLGLSFEKAMQGVSDLFLNTLMKTEDTLEGIQSFEEKRRPSWKNK